MKNPFTYHIHFIFLICLGSFLSQSVYGQQNVDSLQTDTTATELIRIDHADRILIIQKGNDVIKKIGGNIQLRQDTTYMYADSAVIINSDEVHAIDSITIQQGDSLSIFADTLDYFTLTKKAILSGEVVLAHANQQLWTTKLFYNLTTKIATYQNGATLYDDSLQLKSIKGIYNVDSATAKFIDSVVVVHPDFTLAADSLRYLINDKRAVFIGPTRILQDKRDIYCENGFYDIDDKISSFSKNAQYLDDEKQATADTIKYNQNTATIEMFGEVDFIEGDRKILADYLRYNEKTGETFMKGNAFFRDSKRKVKAEEIYYNTKTDQIKTSGKSKLEEDGQSLTADDVDFDNEKQKGLATGNVVWIDSVNQMIMVADSVLYRKDVDFVTAFGNNRPMMKTVMESDTLYLTAEKLLLTTEFDTLEDGSIDTVRHFNAYFDVKIFKENLQGVCDSLSFNSRDSIFRFYKNPILWSDTSQFIADSIELIMENELLDRIILRKNGFIVNQTGSSFYNQIKGKLITAYFDSQEVRRIFVTGNAEAVYYATDEQNAFIGINKSICSEMEFLLRNKQMRTIKFLKEPKSNMMPMRGADHNSLKLEGFNWEVKRRPKSIKDLMIATSQMITSVEVPEGNLHEIETEDDATSKENKEIENNQEEEDNKKIEKKEK